MAAFKMPDYWRHCEFGGHPTPEGSPGAAEPIRGIGRNIKGDELPLVRLLSLSTGPRQVQF
jgi:hypothetical protein